MTVLCSRITCLSSQLTPFKPVISLNFSLSTYLAVIIILCRLVALMSVKRAGIKSGSLEPILFKKKCNQIEIIRFFNLMGTSDILAFATSTSATSATFTSSAYVCVCNLNSLLCHYLTPCEIVLLPLLFVCSASIYPVGIVS